MVTHNIAHAPGLTRTLSNCVCKFGIGIEVRKMDGISDETLPRVEGVHMRRVTE